MRTLIIHSGIAIKGRSPYKPGHLNSQPIFRRWLAQNQFKHQIAEITIANATYKGDKRQLQMAFLECELINPSGGQNIFRNVLIRGLAVAVLVVLIDSETKEKYGVFVKQDRSAIGKTGFAEIIAGMVEGDDELDVTAAREVEEESKLRIDQLIDLGDTYLSPGVSNERIRIFAAEREMERGDIFALKDSFGGLAEEHESTRVCVEPFDELLDHIGLDAKSEIAYGRYIRL